MTEWACCLTGHQARGIAWQGESLVDFERDVLHRETGRQLATTAVQPMIRQLTWDKAGRLGAMQWSGLEQGTGLPEHAGHPGSSL